MLLVHACRIGKITIHVHLQKEAFWAGSILWRHFWLLRIFFAVCKHELCHLLGKKEVLSNNIWCPMAGHPKGICPCRPPGNFYKSSLLMNRIEKKNCCFRNMWNSHSIISAVILGRTAKDWELQAWIHEAFGWILMNCNSALNIYSN